MEGWGGDYGDRIYYSDEFGFGRQSRDDSRWVNPSRRRTKQEAPYGYDEFFIYGDREIVKTADDALYSDRIWQWDHEKAIRLWKQHVDARWNNSGQRQHSAFMSAYLDKQVEVIALAEGCNISNGYPYWIVWLKNVGTDVGRSDDDQPTTT